jgi:hypothetical protein
MSFVNHEDVVEALPPDRADQALDERSLPRRARCNEDLLNSHAANPIPEVGTMDPISVTEHVPGRCVVRKRFDDLLGRPALRWMTGDVEVNDHPSMVLENQEANEDAEVHGRDCEEVDRRDLANMVVQEDAPSL